MPVSRSGGECMIRIVLALSLMVASVGAAAVDWPWSAAAPERLAWCKGFVVGGLHSQQAADVQRTELWLAWNYLIRSGAVDHGADTEDYAAGRARITEDMDGAAVQSALDEADGECGLGRSGRQVTGW